MDTRKLRDTMGFSESILSFVKSSCGGIKNLSKSSWQRANVKAWSQVQSNLFTWILMMVVSKI